MNKKAKKLHKAETKARAKRDRKPIVLKAAPVIDFNAIRDAAAKAAPKLVVTPEMVAQARALSPRRRGVKIDTSRPDPARAPSPFEEFRYKPQNLHPMTEQEAKMAMDNVGLNSLPIAWAAQSLYAGAFQEGLTFLGYAYLAELTQRPEYRKMSERLATEMTRKWIKMSTTSSVQSSKDPDEQNKFQKRPKPGEVDDEEQGDEPGDASDKPPGLTTDAVPFGTDPEITPPEPGDDHLEPQPDPNNPFQQEADRIERDAQKAKEDAKAERIRLIEKEMKRLDVQGLFRKIAEQDGFFGRSHLYIDIGMDSVDRDELKKSIGNGRDDISKLKVSPQRKIRKLKTVEPVWCYPTNYNASDPLADDWFNPTTWMVQGKEVNATRLLTFVGREVPDLLKPSYSFGGLSLSQMAKPYVDNWLRTRQSVSDIISAFSTFVLETNLAEQMSLGATNGMGTDMFKRAELFNVLRDNRGLMMIDKNAEGFSNVAAPLGTLDALQAQSQEQMSSVSSIPLVILLGITPHGLNASSEGEIRTFYDWIEAFQGMLFTKHLYTVIDFIQLSLFGDVDEDIVFRYEPLWSMSAKEKAEMKHQEAETDDIYVNMGAIEPIDVSKKLLNDPDNQYTSLDLEKLESEPPIPPGMQEDEDGNPIEPPPPGLSGTNVDDLDSNEK